MMTAIILLIFFHEDVFSKALMMFTLDDTRLTFSLHIYQTTSCMICWIVFTWHILPLIDLTIFMNLLDCVSNKYLELLCITDISKYHFAQTKMFLTGSQYLILSLRTLPS